MSRQATATFHLVSSCNPALKLKGFRTLKLQNGCTAMNSKRPSIAKSTARAASGGVIVVAALLALMFWKGGMGGGSNPQTSAAPNSDNSTQPQTPTTADPKTPDEPPMANLDTGGLTQDEELALQDKVLGILIDERTFLMQVPHQDTQLYRPAELNRLVELAELAKGDTNGIRVRILQRQSARPSAERQLRTQLASVGITSDAVYLQKEFIP